MFLLSVGFYVFIINRDIFQTEKYYVCAFGGKNPQTQWLLNMIFRMEYRFFILNIYLYLLMLWIWALGQPTTRPLAVKIGQFIGS